MAEIITWEGMAVPCPDYLTYQEFSSRLISATKPFPFECFRLKKGKIFAAEIVGCIQIGKTTITILPKVDTIDSDRDRLFLINLLRAAGYLNNLHWRSAFVAANTVTPIEVFISEIIKEIENALILGLPKRYETTREYLPTPKGKIDMSALSKQYPSVSKVPVIYSNLSHNNTVSQAIKYITTTLNKITKNSTNRIKTKKILITLSNISHKNIDANLLRSIKLLSTETHWKKTLSLGTLVIEGRSPDPTQGGSNSAYALLFPMQHIYERVLKVILATIMSTEQIETNTNNLPLYLLNDKSTGHGVIRLKPDYVFKKADEILAIADAKWKRLNENSDSFGAKREDLYQVFSYMTCHNTKHGLIFAPKAPWMLGSWYRTFHNPQTDRQIHLVSVDIESLLSRNKDTRLKSKTNLLKTITSIMQN